MLGKQQPHLDSGPAPGHLTPSAVGQGSQDGLPEHNKHVGGAMLPGQRPRHPPTRLRCQSSEFIALINH